MKLKTKLTALCAALLLAVAVSLTAAMLWQVREQSYEALFGSTEETLNDLVDDFGAAVYRSSTDGLDSLSRKVLLTYCFRSCSVPGSALTVNGERLSASARIDPEQTPEQLEERRKELIAYYTAEMAKAPEEKPIIHGFEDSGTPNEVSGDATVDGAKYEVIIMNRLGGYLTNATIVNSDFKYYRSTDWGSISKEDAIARADEVMRELGLGDMVLADAQTPREGERKGTWELYYTPSVNGVPIPGIREDRVFSDPAIGEDHQYWTYRCSEETNADTVSWYMESVWITVGRDGILSFEWDAPSTEPVVKETQTALMPFEDIASIANTMLPVVVIGPSEARSLVEIDKINGDETYMDVEITKVSLSLMRVRDKGSLQGTIVPVWDFWGTWNWYEPGDNASDAMKKGATYVTQPMLTLDAIDGNVVSRMFGY